MILTVSWEAFLQDVDMGNKNLSHTAIGLPFDTSDHVWIDLPSCYLLISVFSCLLRISKDTLQHSEKRVVE